MYATCRRGDAAPLLVAIAISSAMIFAFVARTRADEPESRKEAAKASALEGDDREAKTTETASRSASIQPNRPAKLEGPSLLPSLPGREDTYRTVQTVALFGLISLAPIALLDGDGLRADQHRADLAATGPGQPTSTGQSDPDGARALADGAGRCARMPSAFTTMRCGHMPPASFRPSKRGRPAASRSRRSWSTRSS